MAKEILSGTEETAQERDPDWIKYRLLTREPNSYQGEWVGITSGDVVAEGESPISVLKKTQKIGVGNPLICYIPYFVP